MSDSSAVAAEAVLALLHGRSVEVDAPTLKSLLRREPRASHLLSVSGPRFVLHAPAKASDEGEPPPELLSDDRDEVFRSFAATLGRLDLTARRTSAVADLLREQQPAPRGGAGAWEGVADRLDASVRRWIGQRLWSINLAPELVAHDERHVAAVEALVATLVAPFLDGSRRIAFSPEELEWLATAAWLHDWGHVGGPLAPFEAGGANPLVSSSRDVRLLHGMVSKALLTPTWRGMHGLGPEVAGPAGLLCGHHQSWTSFGTERPVVDAERRAAGRDPVDLLNKLHLPTVSLEDGLSQLRRNGLVRASSDLARFQLLVGILRVADGADLGRHRVADFGEQRASFLARCLHREAMHAAQRFDAVGDVRAAHAATIVAVRALEGGTGEQLSGSVRNIAAKEDADLTALQQYVDFVLDQRRYFEDHQLVGSVRFADTDGAFDVIVMPAESGEAAANEAVRAVHKDVSSELGKSGVGKVLGSFGIVFRRVCTPRAHPFSIQRAL